MKPFVVSVNLGIQKGTIKKPEDEIVLIENHGVMNDAHAGIDHKQVSLVGIESYSKMEHEDGNIYPLGAFAENITTEGIILYELEVGDIIHIGETIQEVSQIGKKIHPTNFKTMLPKEGIFTIVLKGGIIRIGDIITISKN